MRNGNISYLERQRKGYKVLILPMRNGNIDQYSEQAGRNVKFLSYLWGMETLMRISSSSISFLVLILPMRNGNHSYQLDLKLSFYCSYPTYEEWKLLFFKSIFLFSFVLILPMRNGNSIKSISLMKTIKEFLSYLWGMETQFATM